MKILARSIDPSAKFLGKGCGGLAHGPEPLLLAHAVNIDGSLIFQIECDLAIYLGKRERFEFFQNRFGRKAFIKALHDGVKRYAGSGHIIAAIALFNVSFHHQPLSALSINETHPRAANSDFRGVPFKNAPDIALLLQYSDYAESARFREIIDADSIESGYGP